MYKKTWKKYIYIYTCNRRKTFNLFSTFSKDKQWALFVVSVDDNKIFKDVLLLTQPPLWPKITPGDHNSNKLKSKLDEYAFTQVTAFCAICFFLKIFFTSLSFPYWTWATNTVFFYFRFSINFFVKLWSLLWPYSTPGMCVWEKLNLHYLRV